MSSPKKSFTPKYYRHLIVDDVENNIYILTEFLSILDIETDSCKSGQEVLDLPFDLEDKYDVIWMDIRMQHVNGVECTRLLRQKYKNITIIAVTGDASTRTSNECVESGIDRIILKPLLFSEFSKLKYVKRKQ